MSKCNHMLSQRNHSMLDISEQCGNSIEQQIALFESIRPLFVNKPVLIGLNEVDIMKREQLSPSKEEMLKKLEGENVRIFEMSTITQDGVMPLRNAACDMLLAARVEQKLQGKKADEVLDRVFVAYPQPRDDIVRGAFIPESVLRKRATKKTGSSKKKTERDIELEMADEYILDLKKNYDLSNADEKYDIIPEIWEGHNIADFVSRNVIESLDQLRKEEQLRIAAGVYEDLDDVTEEGRELLRQAEIIRQRQLEMRNASRARKTSIGPRLSRAIVRKRERTTDRLDEELGVDLVADQLRRLRSASRPGTKKMRIGRSPSLMAISRPESRDRQGIRDEKMRVKASRVSRRAQRPVQQEARKGEADHRVFVKRPKHLFTGKRGIGKTDRR